MEERTARGFGVESVEGLLTVGLSELPTADDGWSLVFIEEGDDTEQDRRLRLDRPCVTDGDGRTAYRAVNRWSLSGDRLTLWFSDEAAAALEIEAEARIRLALSSADIEALRAALPRVTGTAAS